MSLSHLFFEAFISLKSNRMRSLLSTLGIIIGVVSFSLMLALAASIQSYVNKELSLLGKNLLLVNVDPDFDGSQITNGSFIPTFTESDVELITGLGSVIGAAPVVQTTSTVVNRGKSIKGSVIGSDTVMPLIRNWSLQYGEFFFNDDVKKASRVVVIGKKIAESLFPFQSPLYKTIRVNNVSFEVIGVLKNQGRSFDGTDIDSAIYMPYTAVSKYLLQSQSADEIHYAVVQVKSDQYVDSIKNQIYDLLNKKHGMSVFDNSFFLITDLAGISKGASSITAALAFTLGVISVIALGVGGIGIMNIMLVAVIERTKEIGIRLALGAKPNQIKIQFLFESIVICTLGGIIGILISFFITLLVSYSTPYSISLSIHGIVYSLGFSCLIGIFFGYLPAQRASQLQPAENLRS